MACGENPKRVYGGKGGAPSTRMGNVAGYRAAFLEAQAYGRTWDAYRRKNPDRPVRDTRAMASSVPQPTPETPQVGEPMNPPETETDAIAEVPEDEDRPRRWFRKKDKGDEEEPRSEERRV